MEGGRPLRLATWGSASLNISAQLADAFEEMGPFSTTARPESFPRGNGIWLVGALLAELAGICHTLGAVAMRQAACGRFAGHVEAAATPVWQLCRRPAFYSGLMLRGFACYIWWMARWYSPDRTVAPIFLSVSFITNLAAGPSVLCERYRSREVFVNLCCLVALAFTCNYDKHVMDPWLGDTSRRWTNHAFMVLVCFWCFWLSLFLLCIALLCYCSWSCNERAKGSRRGARASSDKDRRSQLTSAPFPALAGLTSGASYFVGCSRVGFTHTPGYVTGFPFCPSRPLPLPAGHNWDQEQCLWATMLFVLGGLSIALGVEGSRRFDCRYFLPAYNAVAFSTATATRVIFSDKVDNLDLHVLVPFLLAHLVVLVGPFLISCKSATITLPETLKKMPMGSPSITAPVAEVYAYRDGTVDKLPLVYTPLLELRDDRGEEVSDEAQAQMKLLPMLLLESPRPVGALSWMFRQWMTIGCALPAVALVLPLLLLIVFMLCWRPLDLLVALAIYNLVVAGSTGLRVAVFSTVGRLRMQLCLATDYLELCKAGRKRGEKKRHKKPVGGGKAVVLSDPFDTSGSSSSEEDDTFWEQVVHVVVVEGEVDASSARSSDSLRGLLRSIAASRLAADQVAVFFAVRQPLDPAPIHPAAPVGQAVGAQLATAGAPAAGMPSGPSAAHTSGRREEDNTRKRAFVSSLQHEFEKSIRWLLPMYDDTGGVMSYLLDFVQRESLPNRLVLVTYTTADAHLPRGYFDALTFAFLASSTKRFTTIWQPPVLELKDYGSQPTLVRHTSLFLSQSQLASLADPFAVPLPASTCSLPFYLLQTITGCWEPDLQLPLKMPFYCKDLWSKCWLTTFGRFSVQPIFLPVLRDSGGAGLSAGLESASGEPLKCCCEASSMDTRPDTNAGLWTASRRGDGGPWAALELRASGQLGLVHFWCGLFLALFSSRTKPEAVGLKRLVCLLLRSVLPLLNMIWSHMLMSTWLLSISINMIALLYGWFLWPQERYDSWPFLLGVTALLLDVAALPMLAMAHVSLLRVPTQALLPAGRADGGGGGAGHGHDGPGGDVAHDHVYLPAARRPVLHGLYLGTSGALYLPAFFGMAFIEEWTIALTLGAVACSRCKGNEVWAWARRWLFRSRSDAATAAETPSPRQRVAVHGYFAGTDSPASTSPGGYSILSDRTVPETVPHRYVYTSLASLRPNIPESPQSARPQRDEKGHWKD